MSTSNVALAALPSALPSPTTTAGEKHTDEEMGDLNSSVEKPSSSEVNWDGDDDPLNPMNWKASKRWLNLVIIAMMAFITYVPGCETGMERQLTSSSTDHSPQPRLRLVYRWSRKRSISPIHIWLHLWSPSLCLALQSAL